MILSVDIRTSVDSMMMSNLKWLKLDQRLNNLILIMLFKCLTGNAPDYSVCDYCTRGNSSKKLVTHTKSKAGFRKFDVRAANLWNDSVDSNTRYNFDSISLGQFKCTLLSD